MKAYPMSRPAPAPERLFACAEAGGAEGQRSKAGRLLKRGAWGGAAIIAMSGFD